MRYYVIIIATLSSFAGEACAEVCCRIKENTWLRIYEVPNGKHVVLNNGEIPLGPKSDKLCFSQKPPVGCFDEDSGGTFVKWCPILTGRSRNLGLRPGKNYSVRESAWRQHTTPQLTEYLQICEDQGAADTNPRPDNPASDTKPQANWLCYFTDRDIPFWRAKNNDPKNGFEEVKGRGLLPGQRFWLEDNWSDGQYNKIGIGTRPMAPSSTPQPPTIRYIEVRFLVGENQDPEKDCKKKGT